MKESINKIGMAIQSHIRKEKVNYARVLAIGRALCSVKSSVFGDRGTGQYWIVVGDSRNALATDGQVVMRDSLFGGVLTKNFSGKRGYTLMTKNPRRKNEVEVTIHNRATYRHYQNSASEIVINLENDVNTYSFQYLSDLLSRTESQQKELAEQKRKQAEEEKKRKELALALEKAAREKALEEERRLKEEQKRQEEEERKTQDAIAKLEADIEESKNQVKLTQSFIRQDLSLRSQHLLDEAQEDAKRSHLYDGVPVVIEGGPGTGKTTTMIQRLKFLISPIALEEYEVPLTKGQIDNLTDMSIRDNHWLFFSPTDKLLHFLQENMKAEYLNANEDNTTTLESFRSKILMAYKLRKPETDGPFKLYKVRDDSERVLIRDAMKAVAQFERFCIGNITSIMLAAFELKTSEFFWHDEALRIKAYCKRAEGIKDIDALIRLLNSLYDNEQKNVQSLEKRLNEELNRKALLVKNNVDANEEMKSMVVGLFERWRQETITEQDESVSENEMDETEDDEEDLTMISYDAKIFQMVKPILKKLALKKYDSNQKLTKNQNELYQLVKDAMENIDLGVVAELSWFAKNYAFLCRGVESNLLNQIPRLYKLYRKKMIEISSPAFNTKLLEKIQKKDGGKRIHPEELELIVGFLNSMLLGIYKKSRVRFDGMKNKYVQAYRENVKHVIGIDEATDYSLIDYYFMSSFCHYEFSSLTLCGDIMQGLNDNGIESWEMLKKNILPNLEVFELKTSYRQLPTLLDMSKKLYLADRGKEAPYSTKKKRSENEPAPLCFISDDEEEKAEWMAKRIIEVYKSYDEKMPSVAIFVGDDVNIPHLVELINDQDYLNGIQIYDCSENRTTNNTKAVRVFRLSEVKGMEFEVVFFYDIDQALVNCSQEIMRRYLYVGISRATTHLAATFTEEDGNEDVISYFDRSKTNWRL